MTKTPIRFQPGSIVVHVGALQVANHQQIAKLLSRHLSGDWGDLDDEDKQANEQALKWGERILSSYKLENGEKLWILTERDRSSTTVLTPGDY